MGIFRRKRRESAAPLDGAAENDASRDLPDSNAPETDPYAALRDIDILGQKSDDGVNRTDDPSRGPIE
jgi:hypothetical protein